MMFNFLNKYKIIIIFILLLVLDVLMVYLHISYYQKYDFFNLDMEQNLPTYYQGFKLLFLAAIFFSLFIFNFIKKDEKNILITIFWLLLTIIFSYLCIDEVGQIHENFFQKIQLFFPNVARDISEFVKEINYKSTIWLVIYVPVVFLIVSFLIYLIIRLRRCLKQYYFFLIGLFFLILVLLLEYYGMNQRFYNTSTYQYLTITEEFFEMIGTSTIVFFALKILKEKLVVLKKLIQH